MESPNAGYVNSGTAALHLGICCAGMLIERGNGPKEPAGKSAKAGKQATQPLACGRHRAGRESLPGRGIGQK